jgi:hypothetical protein
MLVVTTPATPTVPQTHSLKNLRAMCSPPVGRLQKRSNPHHASTGDVDSEISTAVLANLFLVGTPSISCQPTPGELGRDSMWADCEEGARSVMSDGHRRNFGALFTARQFGLQLHGVQRNLLNILLPGSARHAIPELNESAIMAFSLRSPLGLLLLLLIASISWCCAIESPSSYGSGEEERSWLPGRR